MKRLLLLGAVIALAITVVLPNAALAIETPNPPQLFAGQSIPVGHLDVWDNGETIWVQYDAWGGGGWCLVETHLALVDDPADIPQTNSGNPKIGQFAIFGERSGMTFTPPYPYVYTYSYTAPGGSLPDVIYISAQAVVYNQRTGQQETAFAKGCSSSTFAGARWGWYFPYQTGNLV